MTPARAAALRRAVDLRQARRRGLFPPPVTPQALRRLTNRQLIAVTDAALGAAHEMVVTTAADLARYQHDAANGLLIPQQRQGGAR